MRFFIPLMALGLVVSIAAAAFLLIRSCGVRLPFGGGVISACPGDSAAQIDARLAVLEDQRADLRRTIGFLERELAGRQCVAEAPPPPPPPPAPPEDGFDPDAFNERDLAVLEGCWALDTDYTLYNNRTGAPVYFEDWRMCFDRNGTGTQTFRTTAGIECNGPARGAFDAGGRLTIDDIDHVPCTQRSQILRRITTCTIDARGRANCNSTEYDNRSGNPSSVGLRRLD